MFHVYGFSLSTCSTSTFFGESAHETYSDKLKVLELATTAEALEGLLDAQTGHADAVGDVNYARQLLELGEELHGDGAVGSVLMVEERELRSRETGRCSDQTKD